MISDGPRRGRLGAGPDTTVQFRLLALSAVIVLIFGVFFLRLFQLQVIEADVLRQRSQRNSVRTLRLEAPRGDIVDREGRVLATTRPAFGLQVIANDLRRPELTFDALGMLIDAVPADLRDQVGERVGRRRFQPVRLAGDLSYDQLARVESHLYALPGVFTDVRPRRHYLAGDLAAHLLGTIGEIQKEQLETRAYADYRAGEVIGQAGVESLYQSHLRGRAGGRNLVVDVAGRVVEVLDEVRPVPGGRIHLTLDLDLQRVAEEGFLPDVLGGHTWSGAVVALDPRNGDILALVSKPSFDPNDFAGGISAELWQQLVSDPRRPIQNRAISGQYPPGSTYKAIVAAAALEERAIDPDKRVYCPGSFTLGRRTYRCWKRQGHGWMNLRDALVQSCDVYFYQAGLELGIDRLAFFARGFFLGRRTGIPVAQEVAGLVPTRAWKERRMGEPWVLGETVSAAIGQGFNLVTPLQLAVAYSAIANGGKVLEPRLVLHKQVPKGEEVEVTRPEVLARLPVAPDVLERIMDALTAVVEEQGGTAGRARVPGVRVAGKTGTAQVVRLKHTEDLEDDEIPIRHRDHAWFAAIAPAEAPEIVVVVLVEHGGHGGSAAAPIAQRVLARYFEKQREAAGELLAEVAPEIEVAPVVEVVPEIEVAPVMEVVPEIEVAPVVEVVPEIEVAPVAAVVPEAAVEPVVEVVPEADAERVVRTPPVWSGEAPVLPVDEGLGDPLVAPAPGSLGEVPPASLGEDPPEAPFEEPELPPVEAPGQALNEAEGASVAAVGEAADAGR
jgi:penicillin-binding protein 2